MPYKVETQPTHCPVCGRIMSIVHDRKGFSVQACYTHGVFVVDKPTNDTWVLESFDVDMMPIKRRWYTVDRHEPLTIQRYRDMLKWANLRRLEERGKTVLKGALPEEP